MGSVLITKLKHASLLHTFTACSRSRATNASTGFAGADASFPRLQRQRLMIRGWKT